MLKARRRILPPYFPCPWTHIVLQDSQKLEFRCHCVLGVYSRLSAVPRLLKDTPGHPQTPAHRETWVPNSNTTAGQLTNDHLETTLDSTNSGSRKFLQPNQYLCSEKTSPRELLGPPNIHEQLRGMGVRHQNYFPYDCRNWVPSIFGYQPASQKSWKMLSQLEGG